MTQRIFGPTYDHMLVIPMTNVCMHIRGQGLLKCVHLEIMCRVPNAEVLAMLYS